MYEWAYLLLNIQCVSLFCPKMQSFKFYSTISLNNAVCVETMWASVTSNKCPIHLSKMQMLYDKTANLLLVDYHNQQSKTACFLRNFNNLQQNHRPAFFDYEHAYHFFYLGFTFALRIQQQFCWEHDVKWWEYRQWGRTFITCSITSIENGCNGWLLHSLFMLNIWYSRSQAEKFWNSLEMF